jgi:hypothetical protein
VAEKKEEKSVEKSKANALRNVVLKQKGQGKCDKCSTNDDAITPAMPSIISNILSKLGLDLPGMGGVSGHAKVIVIAKKEPEVAPNVDEPTGQKKVLEKEKTEERKPTSPFVKRCVAAIEGSHPENREAESKAFAICNAQKNKSSKDLDKSALERPGYKSRKAEFEQSLAAVRKKQTKQREF